MSITVGRVLAADAVRDGAVVEIGAETAIAPTGRRVPREVVDAADEARKIVSSARERATAITEAAERAASDVRLKAEAEGRAEGVATVAAKAIELAAHEARADERELDRAVALARLLAERLLGEALAIDPTRVSSLARQALREAGGARRVQIVCHPDDVSLLEAERDTWGTSFEAVDVVADPGRSRGQLRIETEIGVLDGDLAPRLDRLCRKLRESLTQ